MKILIVDSSHLADKWCHMQGEIVEVIGEDDMGYNILMPDGSHQYIARKRTGSVKEYNVRQILKAVDAID